jgi:hypothetical protein
MQPRRRERALTSGYYSWTRSSTTSTVRILVKVGFHQLAGHVPYQDGIVVLCKTLNSLEELVASDTICLFLAWVADATDNTEEVQPHHSLLVIQLLKNTREQVGSSQRGSNR